MEQEIALPPPTKRRKRASWRQRAHIVEALHANLDIAEATALGHTNNAEVVEFWTKLTSELNSMGKRSCKREVVEWQNVWRLWCSKVRWKCRRISASLQAIDMDKDGRVSTEEHLSEIEMKIFDINSKVGVHHGNVKKINLSQAVKSTYEKQRPHSTSCQSESTDYVSFSYQIEDKEEMASSAKSRKRTSMDASTPPQDLKVECRVCLQIACCENQCCDIFGPWNKKTDATIASYFTLVTNIQVSPSDRHPKYICFKCLGLLRNCIIFVEKAQCSETVLQKRYEYPMQQYSQSLWPKPIQVDKCLSNDSKIEIEIKQEVLSDDNGAVMETDNEELNMDIKVEPEEYASYDCPSQIMDTISIMPILEDETMNNSDINRYEEENYLEEHIKEEPVSDNESELTLDLPLDCMLCTKAFNSVSGLKAHVIAQHSYLTIARKTDVIPRIYQCFTCRRTFLTHTDLIVHETCHGEYACYMCNSKFETFMLLTKHRKRCRNNGDHVSRLKTLEDVKRPSPDRQHTDTTDSTNTELKSQIMHSTKTDSNNTESQKTHHSKAGDSTNTELKSQKIHHPKEIDSINTELKSQKMLHPKAGNSTNTVLEPQKTHHLKVVDSTNTELYTQSQKICQAKTADSIELELQKMHHSKARDSTNTESQPLRHAKTAHSINTESQTQKICKAKTVDSTELESQKMHDSKAGDSKAANSTSTESQSQKTFNAKLGDSINLKRKSHKIEDSTNTESQPLDNDKTVMTYILNKTTIVGTISDNSSPDLNSLKSNNPVTEENNAVIEENNPVVEENNANSKENKANSEEIFFDSEMNNHNSENNTNSELNNSNSVLNNSNPICESTNQNRDLEIQSPMGDSNIDISIESEDFNLTLNSSTDTNKHFISPVKETIFKEELSSDLSLNTNSTSPKLVADVAEVGSSNVNVVLNNDNVSASEDTVAERSNLAVNNDNVSKKSNLKSVVEMNNTTQSKTESANTSLEISKYSIENTPNLVAESDSMKIHLAIHSLEKKSLDNLNVQIDEEMIETKESSEDKVLQ